MKKVPLLLLFLMIASSLSAQIYRSNLLNQHLEELSSIPQTGYAVEVNGTSSVLYLDGRPVLSINDSKLGTDRTLERVDLESGERKTLFYRNGLLTREISYIGESVQETAYIYINGHLAFCSFISDGITQDTVFFLRSSENDEPVAVKDNDGLRFMSSSYMFQGGAERGHSRREQLPRGPVPLQPYRSLRGLCSKRAPGPVAHKESRSR